MILIAGADDHLGWELRRTLAPLCPVTAVGSAQMPLHDTDAIRRVVRRLRPTLVVNAAGREDADRAEREPERALAVNGVAPVVLAEEVRRLGGGLVHFSSAHVFDGGKRTPYDEGDPPRPANVLGETKLAGEAGVRGVGVPHLIVRTSWVYGAHGDNFARTVLVAAASGAPLEFPDDQRGAPTWSRMVAEATALVLARSGAAQRPDTLEDYGGTYHLAAAGDATWYEFARAILERAPAPLRGQAARVTPLATRAGGGRAHRPANARLDCTKFTETFGFSLPDWRESLDLMMGDLETPVRGERRAVPEKNTVLTPRHQRRQGVQR